MNKRVVILGGSGVGMLAAGIVDQTPNAEVYGFINDVIPAGEKIGINKKVEVLGNVSLIPELLEHDDVYFFNAFVGMQHEHETYNKLISYNIPEDRLFNCIDRTAVYFEEYCKIGKGILLAPLSQLGPDVCISNHCMLFANAYVGHNSFLDVFAHLATNAVVGANVHVGKAVHVGCNSTIREKVTIGDYALIGAGTVVLEDVPERAIVVGNPARILKIKDE